MDALEDILIAILDYCDRHFYASVLLQVFIVGVTIAVASIVLTLVVPVLFIVVLVIGKYCVPVSLAIYHALANLLNL